MNKITSLFRKASEFFLSHKFIITFLVLLFAVLLTNTFHEKYPDEFDSIVGGKYILQGKVPYRDWFQHHQPGAYVLAATILPFSGTSFVRFRLGLAIIYFLIFTSSYVLLKRRIGKTISPGFYLVYMMIAAITATYYWGQMLLADTLASLLIIPALALMLVREYTRESYSLRDVLFISLFCFFVWFNSMTYIIVVVLLTGFVWLKYMKSQLLIKNRNKILLKSIAIIAAPYILFFLFFLLTGSIKEYYFANITYNSNYYIYNYPRPKGKPVNPIRYAIVIAHDTLGAYTTQISGIYKLPLFDPVNMSLAVSMLGGILYFLIRGNYSFSVLLILFLIYENARGNPLTLRQTDYQSSMYILTSLLTGIFVIWAIYKDLSSKNTLSLGQKIYFGCILLTVSFYSFLSFPYLSMQWFNKTYDKYMGTAPLIYDRPVIAPILNSVLTPQDYAWIGPFNFEELFYLKEKVPSKYHWFLDPAAISTKIRTELLSDFERHKAPIIVFNQNYAPWGKPEDFNTFFTEYLKKNYVRLEDINSESTTVRYKWKDPYQGNFDLISMMYFEKSTAKELVQRLMDKGYFYSEPIKTPAK